MIATEFSGINKSQKVKIMSFVFERIEIIALVADINDLASGILDFKFAGERQERRYVAAGPPAR